MGMFKNIFTWWEGATFGTALNTFASGIRIGSDDAGNIYYQAKKLVDGKRRRWVISRRFRRRAGREDVVGLARDTRHASECLGGQLRERHCMKVAVLRTHS